ncbi:hypothetical protein G6F31_021505 [Rhizopus arrhizus]|nr:hypothetical protein G6F31_021505 [Rhizopus arrhizus]
MWRQQARVAGRAQRRLEGGAAQVVAQHQVRHAFEHGDLDLLAASRRPGVQHRRHQGNAHVQALARSASVSGA